MDRVELKIFFYNDNNVKKQRCTVNKWKFQDTMMGEQFITFTITSEVPIDFAVGDFCVFRGETYTLNYVPTVTQKAKSKEIQDSYTYENVKFESFQEELTRCMMLDITPTTGDYVAALGTNYTGSSNFSLFCGEVSANGATLTAVCALAAKMQANLDRMYPTNGWKILVDTSTTYKNTAGEDVLVTHTEDKVLSFNNTTVAKALEEVHNTFELDYSIKGRNIYIGYTLKDLTSDNQDEVFTFGYGKGYPTHDDMNKGLFQIKRIANSQQKVVTRLRVLGSTKNLPYRYYNNKYNLSQSLFPTNLQLPDTFATPDVKAANNALRDSSLRDVKGDTNDSYIDKNDDAEHCAEGVREESARWDGTDRNLPEIFPTIEEATYGELRSALVKDQDGQTGISSFPNYGNTERIDKLLAVGYKDGNTLIDDANKGDGILPEDGFPTNSTPYSSIIGQTTLSYNPVNSGDFTNKGGFYAGPERTLFTVQDVSAGKYSMAPTIGAVWYGFNLSYRNNSVSAAVGYIITIKQTDLQTGVTTAIATYHSDYQYISRGSGIKEMELPELPDVKNGSDTKVPEIKVTALSDITVTFTPVMRNIVIPSDFMDSFSLSYRVGNSRLDETVTYDPEYNWISLDDSKSVSQTFHVFIQDMGFDLIACWTNDTPAVAMKSGRCVGKEFEINKSIEKVTHNGKKGYMLTLKRATDSKLNTYYPSATDPIAAEDYFVLLNISMPDVFIEAAEVRLLRAATEFLADNDETQFTYQPSIDDIYLQRNYDNMVKAGTKEKSIFWRLYAGLKFKFRGIPGSDDSPAPLIDIAIEQVSISMGDGLTPKVELKLNDDIQQSTINKLTTAVDRIYNGSLLSGGGGGASLGSMSATLLSLLQSEGEKLFLSKKKDDIAKGKITHRQQSIHEEGLLIGNFTNMSGGALILNELGQSYGEVDRLKVRLKAYFESLEIQEVNTVGGKVVISPAGAVTLALVDEHRMITVVNDEGESEEVDNGTPEGVYRCYFLGEQEGTVLANRWQVGDQAMSKTFNVTAGTHQGVSNHYYWRLVTAVSSESTMLEKDGLKYHWIDLSKTDSDTGSDIPVAADVVAQVGNRTEVTRQNALIFSAVDIYSPSITLYHGIDNYTFLNKEYVEYGVNQSTNKAFFNVFGDAYIGDRRDGNEKEYVKYENGKLDIAGTVHIGGGSTIGGDTFEEYIKKVSPPVEQEDIEQFVNNIVNPKLEGIQNQIDGVIETWFYNGVPTLTNYPANGWNTEALKIQHLGDLYYDNDTGTAYRFSKNEQGVYYWNVITDDAITKALAAAQKAQDTADGKRRVFTSQPTTQQIYDTGDLWVNATYGTQYSNDILRCVTHKDAGVAFSISHWTLASKYTDDTALNTFIKRYETEINGYKEQLDGKIDTWYFGYDPTVGNKPASDWNATEKTEHAGDLFFNTTTKKVFRWTGTAWESMTDPDIQAALNAASDAQDTADNKRRVFMSQPTVPYDEGDLWISGGADGNTLMVCVADRHTGSYNASEWKVADNAALKKFSDTITKSLEGIRDQLDQKAETWYQSTDPSTAWTTAELKALHKGDLWYNTTDNTTWYWNGTAWQAQDVPDSVFDAIDGKADIFVSKPTSGYNKNDLWFLEADYTLSGVAYKQGTLVVAKNDMGTAWSANDWTKKDRYTDDSALDAFKTAYQQTINIINQQIDKKAETWYQATDPAASWTTAAQKSEHEGDLWYNTTTGKTYYYDGTAWQYQDIPQEVFDKIDGKASIYVSKPTSYRKNDLWILEGDYTLSGVAYTKGELVTATADSNTFNAAHWTKKVKYTDDTKAEQALTQIGNTRTALDSLETNVNNFKTDYDNFASDGVFTSAEVAALQEDARYIESIFQGAKGSYDKVIANELLLDNGQDSTEKINLSTAFTQLKTAKNELIAVIEDAVADYKANNFESAEVNSKYSNFNNKYNAFYQALNIAERYITDKTINNKVEGLDGLLANLALADSTDINGGLILTSMVALRNASDPSNPINAGINGVQNAATDIATWWGGGMKDKQQPDNTFIGDGATSLIRFDGSGYFANGAIWWDKTGQLHADPLSFFVGDNYVGLNLALFQFVPNSAKKIQDVTYVIPQAPFKHLNTVDYIAIGKIKIAWDAANNALKVESTEDGQTANLYATGGVSALGMSSISGGGTGGGLIETVLSFSDITSVVPTDNVTVFNADTVKKIYDRLVQVEGGALTSVSWGIIQNKPTTLAGYGITDAYTKTQADSAITSKINALDVASVGGSGKYIQAISQTDGKISATVATMPTALKNPTAITIQKNGTSLGSYDGSEAKTINISDVASAATLSSHTGNTTVHITAAERTKWNKVVADFAAITGTDTDTIINKWEEVVAFLDTYTEADTLANLLGNKADKTQLASYVTLNTAQTISALKTITAGLKVSGRAFGGGDDEGIVVGRASNNYAALTLGDPGGTRSVFYLLPNDKAVWRYNNGSSTEIVHPAKSGTIALTTDLTWSSIANKPTTLAGYGITDAYTKTDADGRYVNATGDTMTGDLLFSNSGTKTRQVRFTVGDNDYGRIAAGATASNAGWVEIASADDGNEPIYIRQYIGVFSTIKRTVTLLDASGNTSFPNQVAAGSLKIGSCTISWDSANNALKFDKNIYSEGGVSALGMGTVSGGSGGGLVESIYRWADLGGTFSDSANDTFNAYTINKIRADLMSADSALSNRITSLEGGAAVSVTTTGSGNAVTAIAKSGTTITATKGATFLTAHQSLANYLWAQGANDFDPATMDGYYVGMTTKSGITTDWWHILSMNWGTGNTIGNKEWVSQLALPTQARRGLRYRTRNSSTAYGSWITVLDASNTYLSGGVITINGTSITPLTQHQSLANYVTLNGAQTISGAKTFSSAVTAYQIQSAGRNSTWVNGRNASILRTTSRVGYTPLWSAKSENGSWDCGTNSSDVLHFSYITDTNYSAGTNIQTADIQFTTSGQIDAKGFKRSGGTSAQFLKADGSVDSNSYLTTGTASSTYVKKSGDTMTGTLTVLTNGTNNYNQGIRINRTALANWATLTIGYVGTGTLGTSANTWLIGTPSNSNSLIFNLNGSSETAGLCLKGHGNTDLKWNNNTVWHAGNDGSGSGLDADLLDGVHASGLFTGFSLSNSQLTATIGGVSKTVETVMSKRIGGYNSMNAVATLGNCMGMTDLSGTSTLVNPNAQTSWHHFINLSYNYESTNMWQTQFAIKAGTTQVWVRSRSGGAISDTVAWAAPWVQLARTTDNVASATKLQTARTIWGQSFNGTGNVSGDMTSVGHIVMSGYLYSTRAGGQYSVLDYFPNGALALNYGLATHKNLPCVIFGNVGIGNVTEPAYRLDVDGSVRCKGMFIRDGYEGNSWNAGYGAYNTAIINNISQTPLMVAYRSGSTPSATGANRLFAMEFLNSGTELRFAFGGAMRYNFTSNGQFTATSIKLGNLIEWDAANNAFKFNGNLYATGGVSALGTSSTSDVRLKNFLRDVTLDIKAIAAAPSFVHTWKNKPALGEFAGTSAQYWQRVLPQAVSGSKWLALDYGKTALLSAIALAKRSESHEQRITALERENRNLRRELETLRFNNRKAV